LPAWAACRCVTEPSFGAQLRQDSYFWAAVWRDYVCGPPGFTETVTASLRELSVPLGQIHTESFEL
jgi:predicted ferric reductase